MAVVINEFEVVAEPPPANPVAGSTPAKPSPPPPTAREIEQMVRRKLERDLRVWAH